MINLKSIIDSYPNCLTNRATLRSYLLDIYPGEKKVANILASIYECGIAQKIQNMKFLSEQDIYKFANQLEAEYGISPKYSIDFLLIWANAYDVTYSSYNPKPVVEASKKATKKQSADNLTTFFESKGFEVIDKRNLGGCLWVVGEKTKLDPYIKKAKSIFSLTDGRYARDKTKDGRYRWYTRSEK